MPKTVIVNMDKNLDELQANNVTARLAYFNKIFSLTEYII